MKLKKLNKIIAKATRFAKSTDPNVYFVYGNTELSVKEIGQFRILPDVYIYLKKDKRESK